MLATKPRTDVRRITHQTRGMTHGPITRLVSPSDLGELMKPFVFLDLARFEDNANAMSIDAFWHPHSGIATVTVMLDGGVRVVDTTGTDLVLPQGGVEWMRAGNGVWHTGQAQPGNAKAFQLWVALPPGLENGPSAARYAMPEEIPAIGPARVILGSYEGVQSPIDAPPMTYLQVSLKAGEHWRYTPPHDHLVAWVAVSDGALQTPSRVRAGEVAIFEPSNAAIDFVAEGETRFVLGSALPHPHDLVLGNYSVHTSEAALRQGEAEIVRIGRELRDNGTLRRARPAVRL
jgi:redox-sensitive bicupin YhaK (pirin superfamily)